MKSLNTFLFLFLATFLCAQTVADFENFNLSMGSYDNDAGSSHEFISGNVRLPNFYEPSFDSWTGWSVSAMTDVTTSGYLNQYSAIPGSGVDGSSTYAVCYIYGSEVLRLNGTAVGGVVKGLYLTNSTYAYLSMLEGDGFAKKFGGENGDDPDFFKVTIKKFHNGQLSTDSVEFYLADYRFTDNALDYIVNQWTYIDLTPLGNVDSIQFSLASSDVGAFGINTPTYFCVDNVSTADMPSAQSEPVQALNLKAWPNPVRNVFQIDWQEKSPAIACLTNMFGQKILEQYLMPGENNLAVSTLPEGLFNLQVILGDKVYSGIFIKE